MESKTIEELAAMSAEEVSQYEWLLPDEEQKQIHEQLMDYYDRRNFMKDADWVVEMREAVRQKYGADHKYAEEIVRLTLLKQIRDWAEALFMNRGN